VNLSVFFFEIRLSRFTAAVLTLSLMALELLLVVVFSAADLDKNLNGLFEMLPSPVRALMGGSYVDLLSARGFLAFGFTHPLALVLLCAGAITPASRTAVEGAGTGLTDMILSQPVPRTWVLFSRAAAGELMGLFIVAGMWLGHRIGVCITALPSEVPVLPYLYVSINAYALFLAVQGLAMLLAVLSRRRAGAVGLALGLLVFMLFLTVAAEIWKPFTIPSYLSFLSFYQPGKVIFENTFPALEVAVLLGYYVFLLGCALAIYHRRDM
jgi:hypothetical protein